MNEGASLFLVDGLSENERQSALNYLAKEYQKLKIANNDEHINMRRKVILAIWGDLVLARKEPSNHQVSEPRLVADEANMPLEPSSKTVIESGDHGHASLAVDHGADVEIAAGHPIEEMTNSASQLPETEGPVAEHLHETVVSDEQEGAEPNVVPELVDGEVETTSQTEQGILEPKSETDDMSVVIHNAESKDDPDADHMIKAVDEKTETTFIIQDAHDEHSSDKDVDIVIASPTVSDDVNLVNFSDVDDLEVQQLLAFKDVADTTVSHIAQSSIAVEKQEIYNSNLVRLRLLKTGVLHDMILPEGTIVSTLAADAEELIASGTAKKLLIQNESEDE